VANYSNKANLCYSPVQNNRYRTSMFLSLDKKYRSHFEIIALILEAARDSCITRFYVMKSASINCAQLKKYLRSLTKIGFIDIYIMDNHVFYKTSEKGLEFLKQYHVLLSMLLNAHAKNNLPSTVYEPMHSSSQVMAHLQHPH